MQRKINKNHVKYKNSWFRIWILEKRRIRNIMRYFDRKSVKWKIRNFIKFKINNRFFFILFIQYETSHFIVQCVNSLPFANRLLFEKGISSSINLVFLHLNCQHFSHLSARVRPQIYGQRCCVRHIELWPRWCPQ